MKGNLMEKVITPQQDSSLLASHLESIYNRYGAGIYSLCLRLLANERAAESATANVFVRFYRELTSQLDEASIRMRLRELAIEAALARLRRHGAAGMVRSLSDVLQGRRRF